MEGGGKGRRNPPPHTHTHRTGLDRKLWAQPTYHSPLHISTKTASTRTMQSRAGVAGSLPLERHWIKSRDWGAEATILNFHAACSIATRRGLISGPGWINIVSRLAERVYQEKGAAAAYNFMRTISVRAVMLHKGSARMVGENMDEAEKMIVALSKEAYVNCGPIFTAGSMLAGMVSGEIRLLVTVFFRGSTGDGTIKDILVRKYPKEWTVTMIEKDVRLTIPVLRRTNDSASNEVQQICSPRRRAQEKLDSLLQAATHVELPLAAGGLRLENSTIDLTIDHGDSDTWDLILSQNQGLIWWQKE